MIPQIDLKRQHQALRVELMEAAARVLDSCRFILGPEGQALEREVAELCGARHAFMPIAVQAVPPAQFAAWVAAKGGQMPGTKAPSSSVIPQPGAEGSAVEAAQANAAEAVTGPAHNMATPAQSPTSAQGATGNPAGPGNAGQ